MTNNQKNPRFLAVTTLERVVQGAYSNVQVDHVIKESELSDKDVRLYTRIVYGVLQHQLTLDYYINQLVARPSELPTWVRELLATALYQMTYLDKVPNRAIFDESIKIAKQRGHDGIRRLVTGVLHHVQRTGVPPIKATQDSVTYLSITASVPEWIIKRLVAEVGITKTKRILAVINQPARQSIRVNSKVSSMEQVTTELEKRGFQVAPSRVADHALVVSNQAAVKTDLFSSGAYTIQDESAMLPVQALAVRTDDNVLDTCAAPGGKTTQIAESLTTGRVLALDLHAKKLQKIKQNANRLGVDNQVEVATADARQLSSLLGDKTFQRILVDAPCSGLGLLRRKPEIRYAKHPADVTKLAQVQQQILASASQFLQPGGILIYSTCTIFKQENQEIIAQFLEQHPNFYEERVPTTFNLLPDRDQAALSIYPDDFGSDGFFVARLRRKTHE
ncbi:Ribosomal RNA small subunit methyltransferase B [Fructilactobacillus florum 8D]|uniref:16S rRNA (cytosine(967)-C(5))-methyltransferase n=1 Tax=Fructilactobacillus florum 8D TaxID=1221538 RepID=W9EGQ5_9LACO|nr:16S rRNA (cytosine(967)-C(5))-methyltransferase RsmB [Fructilactobacillus florum]ETO40195.1 Ribosomal RNA small subunit methyltransferase B [Fructilactobacillus florum 8D]